jgi:hypothetical protein
LHFDTNCTNIGLVEISKQENLRGRTVTEKAKFRYSAQDGVLEIEGSEEFVSKHFEGLTDIVRVMARHTVVEQRTELPNDLGRSAVHLEDTTVTATNSTTTSNLSQPAETIQSYPNVYSEINGKLKLVMDIRGDSARAKQTTIAMLYCYGASLMGDDQVTNKDIREICEEHGAMDSNFAKIFDDKTVFLSDGVKGGTKQIKLTYVGKKKAKELLSNA